MESRPYGRQSGDRSGQKGQKYPDVSKASNPIEDIRKIYRQGNFADQYKIQDQKMPTVINTAVDKDSQATIGSSTFSTGIPKRDRYAEGLDENLGKRWVDLSAPDIDGKR